MRGTVKSEVHAGVSLLHKAFVVLDLFQDDAPAWGQSEIAHAAGLSRSTASRLVRYLCERGYLIRNDETRRYCLGLAAADLGRRASRTMDILTICRPVLERMGAATGETIILTLLDDAGMLAVCIDQIESCAEGLRVFEKIGANMPLYAGAAPKAILSVMNEKKQARVLRGPFVAFTAHTITQADLLKDDLQMAKIRGYSISREETYPGVAGVGRAFFGWSGDLMGSVAVAAPCSRIDDERLHEFGFLLQNATNEIASRLKDEYENDGSGK